MRTVYMCSLDTQVWVNQYGMPICIELAPNTIKMYNINNIPMTPPPLNALGYVLLSLYSTMTLEFDVKRGDAPHDNNLVKFEVKDDVLFAMTKAAKQNKTDACILHFLDGDKVVDCRDCHFEQACDESLIEGINGVTGLTETEKEIMQRNWDMYGPIM